TPAPRNPYPGQSVAIRSFFVALSTGQKGVSSGGPSRAAPPAPTASQSATTWGAEREQDGGEPLAVGSERRPRPARAGRRRPPPRRPPGRGGGRTRARTGVARGVQPSDGSPEGRVRAVRPTPRAGTYTVCPTQGMRDGAPSRLWVVARDRDVGGAD